MPQNCKIKISIIKNTHTQKTNTVGLWRVPAGNINTSTPSVFRGGTLAVIYTQWEVVTGCQRSRWLTLKHLCLGSAADYTADKEAKWTI